MHSAIERVMQLNYRFYLTKNSWGEKSNELSRKLYMSVPYIRLHTIAIMVHKDAIPEKIRGKLGLSLSNHQVATADITDIKSSKYFKAAISM